MSRIFIQELWEVTGKRRKFGWIRHTLRKSENEICHSALEWNPQRKRGRGRPKTTWRRSVLAECRKSFANLKFEITPITDIDEKTQG
jgi:hypothetical protein